MYIARKFPGQENMPQLAIELALCERYGWTLEYIRSMELAEYRKVIEITQAMNTSVNP